MWAGIIGAGASLLGSAMSSSAAEDGANTAARAAESSAAANLKMYHETADRLQPWVDTGGLALKQLAYGMGLGGSPNIDKSRFQIGTRRDLVSGTGGNDASGGGGFGISRNGNVMEVDDAGQYVFRNSGGSGGSNAQYTDTPIYDQKAMDAAIANDKGFGALTKKFSLEDFQADPSYAFRQAEGEKALTRGAAARGMAQSTPGLKDLMRFNQGLASTEYGAAYTRDAADKQRQFDYLSYLSGGGQNAAAQVGNAGQNAAASSAMLTAQAGQIAGQGITNSANLMANGINSGVGNYMYQQRYNDMMALQNKKMDAFSGYVASRSPMSSGAFGMGAGD